MGDVNMFLAGVIAGFLALALLLAVIDPHGAGRDAVHEELCPVVLEHTPTYADSLAVIYEHEGCWEFVHPPAP